LGVPPRRDDETGKYTSEFSHESFVEALTKLDTATTSDVANYVGCSYDLAYRRLLEFFEEGLVERQKIGGSFVWRLAE